MYQMISLTIFYNHVIRYINNAQISKKTYDIAEKITTKGRRYANKIANISVTNSFRELKLVSNDWYDDVL